MIQENFILVSIIYYVLSVIVIIAVLSIVSRFEKNKLKKEIENLEKEKNLIISSSILSELNKVKALAKNDELKEKYQTWKEKFEIIKGDEITKITENINDIEVLFLESDYKKLKEVILDCEYKINSLKTKTELLLSEIKEITLSEERNRETITKLKAEYREIVQTYTDDVNGFLIIKKPIELQFENANKLFSSFEKLMEENKYSEVSKVVKAIDDIVLNLKAIINETKSIETLGKKLIPKKIEEIIRIEKAMRNSGFNLDYLNIEYNIEETNKKLSDIFQRLNVLNIEDSLFDLKIMYEYFASLFSDFEKEKNAKVVFEDLSKKVILKSAKLERANNSLIKKLDDLKYNFLIKDEDIATVFELKDELSSLRFSVDKFIELNRSKTLPFTRLAYEINVLCKKTRKQEEKLNMLVRKFTSLQNDELRAREQLSEVKKIIATSKNRERGYKLTETPKSFYIELSEAMLAMDELEKELNKRPIEIDILNLRVDTARDLTLKVYTTINETVKTAKMAESAIVYGNRYKAINKDVNFSLLKAEVLFHKGNYKGSLELAINAINILEPGIYETILKEYK